MDTACSQPCSMLEVELVIFLLRLDKHMTQLATHRDWARPVMVTIDRLCYAPVHAMPYKTPHPDLERAEVTCSSNASSAIKLTNVVQVDHMSGCLQQVWSLGSTVNNATFSTRVLPDQTAGTCLASKLSWH